LGCIRASSIRRELLIQQPTIGFKLLPKRLKNLPLESALTEALSGRINGKRNEHSENDNEQFSPQSACATLHRIVLARPILG
jgi:hypothetical protein